MADDGLHGSDAEAAADAEAELRAELPGPVAALLDVGESGWGGRSRAGWSELRSLGLGAEHAEVLARLVVDPRLQELRGTAGWATLHVPRALALVAEGEAVGRATEALMAALRQV